jgi:hypothetical protein
MDDVKASHEEMQRSTRAMLMTRESVDLLNRVLNLKVNALWGAINLRGNNTSYDFVFANREDPNDLESFHLIAILADGGGWQFVHARRKTNVRTTHRVMGIFENSFGTYNEYLSYNDNQLPTGDPT